MHEGATSNKYLGLDVSTFKTLDGSKLKCINSNSADNVSVMWSLYASDSETGSQ